MVFSSISFLFLFLPVVFGLFILIPSIKAKNIFLTIASLIFYAWGEPVYVLLMLFSVLMNWIFGQLVTRDNGKIFLIMSVVFNVGLLMYFKYFVFFISSLNILPFVDLAVPDIRLPIGISFFTFQAMSYVFDVRKKEVKVQKNFINLLLYISLFPQLIAGPIVKYHDIDTQISKRSITSDKITKGIRRFIIGLAKKVLIANQMAFIVDNLFSINTSELDVVSAWIGAICYLFQIYFDFSGYSDMAIGLGQMFGFEFKENFNYPLTSTSIKDFWRRWHISLSTWFKEYLYIPLGGNRHGKLRTYVNQFIVFLATGLWHGANFTFVLWGLLHGLFLVLETSGFTNKLKWKWIKHLYTLLIVTLLFVIFRADNLSYAFGYLQSMFTGFNFSTQGFVTALSFMTPYTLFILFVAIIASTNIIKRFELKLNNKRTLSKTYQSIQVGTYIIAVLLFAMCVLMLSSNSYNPFIYFRF